MLSKKTERQQAREYVERRLMTREYDDLVAILKGAEVELDWAPSRSTFYGWVKEWRAARARDRSGTWSLATDATGRPDIVLRVIAALAGQSGGKVTTLTVAEAHWVALIASAVPDIVRDDRIYRSKTGRKAAWGSLELWSWALQYLDAETAGDSDRLAELDTMLAVLFSAGGVHAPEAFRGEGVTLEGLYQRHPKLLPSRHGDEPMTSDDGEERALYVELHSQKGTER